MKLLGDVEEEEGERPEDVDASPQQPVEAGNMDQTTLQVALVGPPVDSLHVRVGERINGTSLVGGQLVVRERGCGHAPTSGAKIHGHDHGPAEVDHLPRNRVHQPPQARLSFVRVGNCLHGHCQAAADHGPGLGPVGFARLRDGVLRGDVVVVVVAGNVGRRLAFGQAADEGTEAVKRTYVFGTLYHWISICLWLYQARDVSKRRLRWSRTSARRRI